MAVSLGTPCANCSHPRNVHVVDPGQNEAPGDKCLACPCTSYRPVQCMAHYGNDSSKELVRCERPKGHPGDHGNDVFCWTDRVAMYPSELEVVQNGGVAGSQVGGDHYRQTPIQPWDIIDAWGLDFYRGNALKYLLRAGRKGPALEDLRKCRHYLDKIIEMEEGKS